VSVPDPVIVPNAPVLATSPGSLGAVTTAVSNDGGRVGLDTETTGLNPAADRVRLLQLATRAGVFVVDLFALPHPAADLAPLFAALAAAEVVGHNLLFDLRFLAPLGFVPGRVFCTQLASRVLHAGEWGADGPLRHSLQAVARRHLGRDVDKTAQVSNWSAPALTPEQIAYAAEDAAVLLPLAEALAAKLAEAKLTDTAAREMRALPGIAWAALIAVDSDQWLALAATAEAEADRLAAEMDALAPDSNCLPGAAARNWNSQDQVREAFAAVGVDLPDTRDATLAGVDHPLAGLLRDHRAAGKRAGTYGRAWLAEHAPGGSVLPTWHPLGAESGRMSCSDPGLQQIPRGAEYRRCFVARPGHVLVKADYSQVELRAAAAIAPEPEMQRAYRAGEDLHALTAARLLGKKVEEVTKEDRQLAKAVNFGLLFGMGWRGLKGYARAHYGVALTDDQARGYRDAFFRAYPGLRAWHGRVGAELARLARSDADARYHARTVGGRRVSLAAARRDREGTLYPNKAEALNAPVQGTAADGLKAAIGLLWERRAECPGAVPVLFVHDEVVVEAPADSAGVAAEWLKQAMVDGMAPLIAPVPVEVEVTVGRTWGG
jgi:DNA polymerase-1